MCSQIHVDRLNSHHEVHRHSEGLMAHQDLSVRIQLSNCSSCSRVVVAVPFKKAYVVVVTNFSIECPSVKLRLCGHVIVNDHLCHCSSLRHSVLIIFRWLD